MYIFICEDSLDGIFTGVYDAWDSGYGHNNVSLISNVPDNYTLFSEYINVVPDIEKSKKVSRTLCNKFGMEVYQEICNAIMSDMIEKRDKIDKAEAVYRTIVEGLGMKQGSRVLENLSNPYIAKVFRLSRTTGNEAHHYLGFLRFRELSNGVLYALIHPKNDIIHTLATHFSDRLPNENFLIHDDTREIIALHKAGKGYIIVDASLVDNNMLSNYSLQEELYNKLWEGFFNSIAIEGRINTKLQSQNIPKRFWKDTVELKSKV